MSNSFKKLHVSNLDAIQAEVINLITPDMFQFPRIVALNNYQDFIKLESLRTFLMQYGLSPTKSYFLPHVFKPNGVGTIHIDTGPSQYSINLPIKNCQDTVAEFFEVKSQPELIPVKIVDGTKYTPHYKFEPEVCELIDSIDTSEAYIIDTKVPHRVVSNNSGYRVNLLIRNGDSARMAEIFSNDIS